MSYCFSFTISSSYLYYYRFPSIYFIFHISESKEYASMFPGITRSGNLNSAIIEGLKKSSETYLNTQYANILGTGVYQRLQQDYNKLTGGNYSFYNVSSGLQNYLNGSDTGNYDEEFINSLNNSNNVETALTGVGNYLNSYGY